MRNKIFFLVSRVILAGVLLAACAPTAPTPEKIIQTVEVIETQIVEVASTPIVVTATPRQSQLKRTSSRSRRSSKIPTRM